MPLAFGTVDFCQVAHTRGKASSTPKLLDEAAGSHWYVALLGLEATTLGALHAQLQKGFRFRLLSAFARQMALSLTAVCSWIGLSPRTLERRRKEGRLSAMESDRLLTTARIGAMALRLFEGDREAATRWLAAPHHALGGATPMERSRTEFGAREVEDLIGRIEHGVIS